MAAILKPRKPSSTSEALQLKAGAEWKRTVADDIAPCDPTGACWRRLEAHDMDAAADEYLDPLSHTTARPYVGNGGELVDDYRKMPGLVDTVRCNPDLVTVHASTQRLDLAANTGALDLAVDAADSIEARNSLEKMLAHEMAAAHNLAMKLAGRSIDLLGQPEWSQEERVHLYSVEATRLANASARLMETYQRSIVALARFRDGGRQVVTVQHVQVNDGGQAIVAGGVTAGE